MCAYALDLFNELAGVLGLLYNQKDDQLLDEEVEKLIEQRNEAVKIRIGPPRTASVTS